MMNPNLRVKIDYFQRFRLDHEVRDIHANDFVAHDALGLSE